MIKLFKQGINQIMVFEILTKGADGSRSNIPAWSMALFNIVRMNKLSVNAEIDRSVQDRISEVVGQTRFASAAKLELILMNYLHIYNHAISK